MSVWKTLGFVKIKIYKIDARTVMLILLYYLI